MTDELQTRARERVSHLGRKLLSVAVVAVLVVGTFVFVFSVLPRWWAQQVGDQVDGDLTTGGLLGFVYGFLAALLALLVLGIVWQFGRRTAWAWVVGVAVALFFASPVLVTLGITIGTGSAAHAADRTLDVQAPWFRGGMVVGVALAVLLAAFLAYVLVSRSRARQSAREAREQLAAPRA